jgi:hypothetical protein
MKQILISTFVGLAACSASAQVHSNAAVSGMPNAPTGLSTGATTGSGVAAPAGSLWSECPNDGAGVANTVAGFGAANALRLADDFTIPAGETWTISDLRLFGYVTGSAPGTNPWTAWTLAINSGSVNGPVVFGDLTTNRMGTVTNTNLYRVFSTTTPPPGTAPGTTRLIREVTIATPGLVLGPGTYWINFNNTAGFVPPLTDPGTTGTNGTRGLPGWNSLQFNVSWVPVLDAGNPGTGADIPQDLPFIINYTKPSECYPDCDGDGVLTIDDFICFQTFFALGDPYADCDGDGVLTIDDFICFQTFFAIGC